MSIAAQNGCTHRAFHNVPSVYSVKSESLSTGRHEPTLD